MRIVRYLIEYRKKITAEDSLFPHFVSRAKADGFCV